MNAPEPGTIKEFFANEEDTVTVGQDLLKMELGAPPKGGEKQQGGHEPKAPASEEQSTSSHPEPQKDEAKAGQYSPPPSSSEKKPEPSKQESKPSPPPNEPPRQKEPSSKPQESRNPEHKPKDTAPLGNREERRASFSVIRQVQDLLTNREGKNEPYALTHLRASETVSEYRCLSYHVQRSRYVEHYAISEIVQG